MKPWTPLADMRALPVLGPLQSLPFFEASDEVVSQQEDIVR